MYFHPTSKPNSINKIDAKIGRIEKKHILIMSTFTTKREIDDHKEKHVPPMQDGFFIDQQGKYSSRVNDEIHHLVGLDFC
jgi:hypothetical protein